MTTTKRPNPPLPSVVDIVGAGLQGLLVAHEVMDVGLSVRLWDRAQIGIEASWAGGGILSPLYPWRYPVSVSRLSVWSQAIYSRLAQELASVTGIDCGWIKSGMLVLGNPEPAAQAWAKALSIATHIVNKTDMAEIEPMAQGNEAGLWLPDVAQIRNPRLIKALRAKIQARGGQINEGVEVKGFVTGKGRLRMLTTSVGDVPSALGVITAGAWTGQLLRNTGLSLPVEPVRGQMISFALEPGALRRIVLGSGFYVIPRHDGLVLVGSTLEHVGFDRSTTVAARNELQAAACRIVPALIGVPIRSHWAGLRPGSPNDIPYIGAHPYIKGLYVNAGHYRNGIVMAPASARLMADLILDRPPTFDPTPYQLPVST